MADKVYNVKLPEEVRERWQGIVTSFAEQNGINKLGDVYPYLIEIIESSTASIAPDFKGFVDTINSNLSSIRSSVLAMNDAYEAYQENAVLEKEKSEKELIEEIKGLKKDNGSLKEDKGRLEDENEELRERIKQLESQLDEQKNIEKILAKLNSLISEDEDREEENFSDEPIKGQMTLEDYRQGDKK